MNERAVLKKFGVLPSSISDYLALVGDISDGIPGVSRWGAKAAATLLSRYPRIEDIPENSMDWDVWIRGAQALSHNLNASRAKVEIYKFLATLRTDVPIVESLCDLAWSGVPTKKYQMFCQEMGMQSLSGMPHKWNKGG